ncbi:MULTISPECIES: hypothetical protein [Xanthomonas]|uniref:hypothetical protein n=1 Tax=Xanthomonas TaxID=338 RepID=UPI0003650615|nr:MULTISPECIES: hypothetical protein [Xanthomonas]MCW0373977.1 hypothetical protein [Xanthomonas sacchari]MCW0389074.1 hypothetical protein [Xanthomonas sacchari]MCW0394499.1 hypothetical protein [Xanthomonas sacchari]MCW0403634.1 hypothetical protein [Xanthomonas sacchari]MCW0417541.1 hypothetical protein [Xanthomonas sacchari]
MDPKLHDVLARTNVAELVQPACAEQVTHQPVQPEPAPPPPPRYATSDPFQYHLASTEVVGKLAEGRTSPALRFFGWLVFGLPMASFGLMMLHAIWYDASAHALYVPHTLGQAVRMLLGTASALAFVVAYPYFTRRRTGKTD